jgi:hypothetical protein
MLWQQLWWTFLQSAWQLHTPLELEPFLTCCCVTKLHILEWPFIVPSTRCTKSNDHVVYLASWYATPVRSMDYLCKWEMLTSGDVNTFVHNIVEKFDFCAHGKFLGSFISAHDVWDQNFTCCVYIFCSVLYIHTVLWKSMCPLSDFLYFCIFFILNVIRSSTKT